MRSFSRLNFVSASMPIRSAIVLFLANFLVFSVLAVAQSTTEGAVSGTVLDPQGAVIPGATVVVHNTGTNAEQTATTDGTGAFRVIRLQPATYDVTVTAAGFATAKTTGVVVNVGSVTDLPVHLKVSASGETVTVGAELPNVNTTSADFAPVVNETAVHNLPINGGRWSSFAILTPGVVSNSDGFGLLSFRGTSALLNNVTVDGADNNQAFFSEERGRTRAGYSTAKVAVQEFQVNTSNYSSEYGRSAGGVINTVTKSGSNQLHGEAYWYDRDNDWGTTNPYTTLTSVTQSGGTTTATTNRYKPIDVRMMGGFGVGGAIIKDKVFWFLAYDKFHRNFPGFSVPNSAASFFAVPDAALPSGKTCGGSGAAAPTSIDFNVCTLSAELFYKTGNPTTAQIGNANSTAGYGSAAQMWINGVFGGNGYGYNQLGVYSLNGSVTRKGDQDIIFPKVDWIINQKNHAFFEVNRMRWASPGGVQTQSTNAYGPSSFGNDYVKDTWGVAKLDTQISSKFINQLRFQYGRDFEYETDQAPNAYEAQTLINPVNALTGAPTGYSNPTGLPPNVYIGSYQWGTLYYTNRIAYPDEYKTQVADTVNYVMGHHNLKFGVDYAHSTDSINNLYQQYGEYSFSGLPQYLAELYDPTHAYFTDFYQGMQGGAFNTVPSTFQSATNDFAVFAQDDWNVSRRLTINLGLRWDTETLPSPYKSLEQQIQLGTQTLTTGLMPDRPNGIGPRVGFALDLFGDTKSVLRGGYGIYYGRVINAQIYSALTSTGNTSSSLSQITYDYFANRSGAALTNGAFPAIYQTAAQFAAGKPSAAILDKNFKFPQVQEIDLSFQHELGWNTVLSVSYLGSFAHHLANFTDLNLAAPGSPYCATVSSGSQNTTQVNGQAYTTATCPNSATIKVITPPSTIGYTLSNTQSGNAVGGMPVTAGTAYTVPFYTSRLNGNYNAVIDDFSGANSNYNALAVQFEKRMSNFVQFSLNYTWSHALDTGVNGTTSFSGTTFANVLDPRNPNNGMYGNSSNNVPQRLTFNSVLESPWKHTSLWRYLLDGWVTAPLVQVQSGLNYSVSTSGTAAQFSGAQKFTGIQSGILGAGGALFLPGTRGGYLQPNTYIFDMRFAKRFSITERFKAEFSADGFNVLNHNNVTGVNTTAPYSISAGTATAAPALIPNSSAVSSGKALFGTPTSGNSNFVYNTRQIQLGARFSF